MSWTEVTTPVFRQLKSAALVGCGYSYNVEGAAALGAMLEEMAGKLDVANEQIEQLRRHNSIMAGIIGGLIGVVGALFVLVVVRP